MPRAYIAPPPFLPTSRVVDFSRRLAVYVWNFHQVPAPIQTFPPRLELLTFPDGWRAELLIFPECRLRIRARFSPSPGAKHFPPRLELLTFPETGGPPA